MVASHSDGYQRSCRVFGLVKSLRPPRFAADSSINLPWSGVGWPVVVNATTLHCVSRAVPSSLPTQLTSGPLKITAFGCSVRTSLYQSANAYGSERFVGLAPSNHTS